MGSGWQDPASGYWPGKLSLLLGKRLQLPVLFLLPPSYCSFQHTATLPIYYQTSPTPLTFGHMPPVDTPLTLGPIGALCVLALVCLLQNINADSKKKKQGHGNKAFFLFRNKQTGTKTWRAMKSPMSGVISTGERSNQWIGRIAVCSKAMT